MMTSTARQERTKGLEKLARAAIKQYNDDMGKGGEPLFPDWALQLLGLIADYESVVLTLEKQRFRVVDVVDFETNMQHFSIMTRPPFDKLGVSQAERDMIDDARRDRNIVLAIVAVMMVGYLALCWVGGTGL